MITSNAKTPKEFRQEVCDELNRRMAPYNKPASSYKTQKAADLAASRYSELAMLLHFIMSIEFIPKPE